MSADSSTKTRKEEKNGKEEDILSNFQSLDVNKDGVISRDELGIVLQELDKTVWTEERLDALIKHVDKNGDGLIDYVEFVDWISKSPRTVDWKSLTPGTATSAEAEGTATSAEAEGPESEDWCRWRFQRWDLLHRGYITIGEFGFMLNKYYPLGVDMADLKEVFHFVSSGCKGAHRRRASHSSTIKIMPDDFVKWIVHYKGKGCHSVARGTVSIPLKSHIGFILGGSAGDQVILSTCAEVRRGWRVITFTAAGRQTRGEGVGPMLQRAIEQNQSDIVVEFDVEDLTAWKKKDLHMGRKELGVQQEVACVELADLLEREFHIPSVSSTNGLRPDIEALATLHSDIKAKMFRNSALMRCLAVAKAVHEFEALLGKRSVGELQLSTELLKSIDDDDIDTAKACVDAGADLLFLDNCGNVPVHNARSTRMATMLAKLEPRALEIKNQDGQTPLQTFVAHLPLDVSAAEALTNGNLHTALSLDKDGVSACMQMQGGARKHFQSQMSSWEQMERALTSPSPIMSLESLTPKGYWKELLAFHIFGEPHVWAAGLHTDQSRDRLRTVWDVIRCILETLEGHNSEECPSAVKAAQTLLQATKGPRAMMDARDPYRDELSRAMARLARQSEAILNSFHAGLSGDATEWLRSLEGWFSSELAREPLADHGLEVPKRVRMDFCLSAGSEGLHLPSWATDVDVDFVTVLADLKKIGALEGGQRVCPNDTAYQFLHLAFGDAGADLGVEELQHDASLARCFAGWLRGLCQQNQVSIRDSVCSKLEPVEARLGKNFYARSEAKGIQRICEKTGEEIADVLGQLKERGLKLDTDIHCLLKRSAGVVSDINGCTFVAESPEQLKAAYELLLGLKPLAMKNRFSKRTSGYMDVKLMVPIVTPDGPLVTEIQLLFSDAFAEKEFMHLPYEYWRGSMDWPHAAAMLPTPSEEAIGHCPQGHQLKALGETPDLPWLCDDLEALHGCKSSTERYRCEACDYDLCQTCYRRSAETETSGGNCPNGHQLEPLGRVELRDWICDGRHHEGGCESNMKFVWARNRFCCSECDYDLCQMCLLSQLDVPD